MPEELDIEGLDAEDVESKLEEIKAKLKGEETKPKSEETEKTEKPSKEDITFKDIEEEEDDDYDRVMKQVKEVEEEEGKTDEEKAKEAEEKLLAEEEAEEKKAKEEPVKELEEVKLTPEQAKDVKEAVLKIAGEDKILKIKDKEVPLKELTPDEIVFHLQRGIRADDVFKESARIRKEVDAEKNILSERTDLLSRRVREGEIEPTKRMPFPQETSVPKELEPDDLDTEKETVLKDTCRNLIKEVNQLKVQGVEQVIRQGEQDFSNEINAHKGDFPLASTEEVIAVRTHNSKIPIREIMQVSDAHYGSVEFVKEVFKHRPDIKRHFTDEIVSDYKHKISKRRGTPEKPSGTVKVKPVATESKLKLRGKKAEDYSFADAEALAKKAAEKLKREYEEE